MSKEIIIYAPVDGEIKKAEEINDPVFSEQMMGPTFAIHPSNNVILAPVSGVAKAVFPTGHAYGIEHKSKIEILTHIGIDTVALNGKGFEAKVSQGSKIKEKEIIAQIDFNVLEKSNKDKDIIVVATNLEGYEFQITAKGLVKAGDPVAILKK